MLRNQTAQDETRQHRNILIEAIKILCQQNRMFEGLQGQQNRMTDLVERRLALEFPRFAAIANNSPHNLQQHRVVSTDRLPLLRIFVTKDNDFSW